MKQLTDDFLYKRQECIPQEGTLHVLYYCKLYTVYTIIITDVKLWSYS